MVIHQKDDYDKVICPVCQKENKKSKVYYKGKSTDLMGCPEFYDTEGNWYYHDINRKVSVYECTNGHAWGVTEFDQCWCGFNKDKPVVTNIYPPKKTKKPV